MMRGIHFARLVRFVARRPIPILAGVGILAVLAAVYALRLQPSASTDTLVNRSSGSFKATERFKRQFGDDAVVVLVKGDLQRTLLTSDLAETKPAKVVYGPGTFINTAVEQISKGFQAQIAQESAKEAQVGDAARR